MKGEATEEKTEEKFLISKKLENAKLANACNKVEA
jgi:hypothetical protein